MQGGNPYGNQGFGGPGMSFEDNDSFIIGGSRKNRKRDDPNNQEIERQHGVFHDKLGSIIGPAYIGGNQ